MSICVKAVTTDSMKSAHIGYLIIRLSDKHTIASHNASNTFIPASTLKCVTTAAALSKLGPQHTFNTEIFGNGDIVNDTLQGSIIIEPHGDPSTDATICDKLASRFSHITGTIYINSTHPYINPAAMIEDIGTDYGVGWATFNYKANSALMNENHTPEPLQNITDDFLMDLYSAGITIGHNSFEPADTTIIFNHESEPLVDLCRHMMQESDNLYAESIGRSLSRTLDLNEAIDSINSFMNGFKIKPGETRIVDMSGLSRANMITPRNLATILTAMSENKDYLSCFPIAGQNGTVKRFLNKTRLNGKIAIKSGSMTGVLTYAGYKLGVDNRPTHAIVIMVNNAMCKQSVIKQYIEQWLLKYF